MAERIIIFGAGNCGMLIANSIVGECDLVCFIDNDQTKNGKIIEIDNFVGGGGYLYTIPKSSTCSHLIK